MKRSLLALAFVAVAAVVSVPAVVGAEAKSVDEQIGKMHWARGTQSLSDSHGTFVVPEGGTMVTGAEAKKFDELTNADSNSDSEGVMITKTRTLFLSYNDSGYVTADDWKDVDAAKMLSDMKDSSNDANEDRKKAGIGAIYVDRWVEEPTFDKANASVRWIVGAHDDSGKTFVNAVALSLGRHGYERFTLVSDGSNEAADKSALASYVHDYTFDKGSRFTDYVSGDKVAGYGLAALVATGAGVTLAKTGLLAAALIFLKKFVIVIIALVAGLFNRIRSSLFGPKAKFGPPATAGGPPLGAAEIAPGVVARASRVPDEAAGTPPAAD